MRSIAGFRVIHETQKANGKITVTIASFKEAVYLKLCIPQTELVPTTLVLNVEFSFRSFLMLKSIPIGLLTNTINRMAARRAFAFLLTDSNALLSGILTDKDIATRFIACDIDFMNTPVSKAMIKNSIYVLSDTLSVEALRSETCYFFIDGQKMSIFKFQLPVDFGECFSVIDNPNITVHYNTETVDVVSNTKGQMSGIKIRNLDSAEESVIEAKGLFYGIGHSPNSQLLQGQVDLDDSGYILVKDGNAKTSVEGVFAAGDVQDHEWRQAITAAGSGCIAALSVERYLVSNNLLIEFHQELTPRDVQEGFDITLTKHKGQYALRKLYHESPRLIYVLYTSPTCGPCRTLKPILGKVIDEFDQNAHFVEIDIEEDPEVAEAANIMGTPCVQFFKNKEMFRNVAGAKMKKEYREFIEANK
ncbi:hypothetical protein LXL04_010832 [Taraxacum kok-saghyz]